MATPTANAVQTTGYDPSIIGDDTDTLLYGTKWGGAAGTGVTLTYSFPQGNTWWLSPYSDDDEPDSFYGFSDAQMTAARDALGSWAAVASIHFTEVADNQNLVGEIRFAFTDNLDPDIAAHAYMPNDDATAGDVWFNSADLNDLAEPGSYFHNTIIHEVGHALGLNHSFDFDPVYDNNFYSVMAYTASPWSDDGDTYASFYPTTPMYYDIVALQAIYGTEGLKTNAGRTTYSFDGGTYFETIFDTGGNDTIVYSGSDTCRIDLREGHFSALSDTIEFSTAETRHTVCIGPDTVIENATAGNRNDRIEGNGAKNVLRGSGGRDTILGGSGNDTLVGGTGFDKLKGNAGTDKFDFNTVAEIGQSPHDLIMDFASGVDRIDLSTIDANSLKTNNNAFKFKTVADSSLNGKAGELCWYNEPGKTFVIGDIDGNKVADFMLELTGVKSLTAADFVL